MMRNMTPAQMQNMRQMMNEMSPAQLEHMQRMAASMGMGTPASSAVPQAQTTSSSLSGARVLKEDGNSLHKAGYHAQAILKYESALQSLGGQTSTDAILLQTVCELNQAMCHLKLRQWQNCAEICAQVLQRVSSRHEGFRNRQCWIWSH